MTKESAEKKVDHVRSDVQPSSFPESYTPRFKIEQKVWMKNKEGHFVVLVWVLERQKNENRGGWDYKLRQKDNDQVEWVGEEHWRAETELKRA